jgi:CubicO group peptidase (beta-lactamase class C family)
VIERVQGCSYEDAIRRLVLEPLGCERSFFFADEVITHRFAVGHLKHEDGTAHVARPWAMPRSIGPAGGLACSIEDLMRYASAYVAPAGETLLDPASIAEMTRPQVDAGAMFDAMGLSWMLDEVDGTTLAFHSGDTNGQVASLLLVPSRRFAVGVLTNCDDAYGVYTPLTDWCLETFTGLCRQAPAVHALDAAALGEYAGRYETRLTHMDVHARDGGIEVDVFPHAYLDDMEELPPPIRVEAGFYAPDRTVVTSGPYARLRSDFVRGDDGRIRWFRFGGRLSARADGDPAAAADPARG